jgi:Sec-independent protein secretion pathway component TatC
MSVLAIPLYLLYEVTILVLKRLRPGGGAATAS